MPYTQNQAHTPLHVYKFHNNKCKVQLHPSCTLVQDHKN